MVCWDFGTNLPQYVHRIGRTGRQGQPGNAHAFFTRNLAPLLPDLLELLKAHGQPIDPHLQRLVDAPAQPVGGGGGGSVGGGGGGGGEARDGGEANGEGHKRAQPGRGDELGEEESEEEGAPQRWLVAKLVSPITGLAGTFRHDGLAGRKAAAARGGDGDDEERKRRKREKKKARKLAGECTESSRA